MSASCHPCWSSACRDKCSLVQGLFFAFVFCLCLLCKHFPFSLSPFWFLWLSPYSIVWVTLAMVSLLSLPSSAVFLFFFNRIHSCTPHLFSVESSHPFSPNYWRLLVGLVLHQISMYFIFFFYSFIHFVGEQEAIFGSPAIVLFKIHVPAPQD